MSFFGSSGTEIKNDVVGKRHYSSVGTCCWKPNGILFKLIAIAQEFNAPFLGRNIKIYPAAFVSVFGKGYKRTLGISVAAAVKFVLILCFRRTLDNRRMTFAPASNTATKLGSCSFWVGGKPLAKTL